jgi:hypothetical protein
MKPEITDKEQERFNMLLMKALDGELSGEEKDEFEQFVERFDQCRAELNKYSRLKEVVMSISFKDPPDEVWDHYWMDVYNRIERGVGWILLSIGCIILVTYGAFHIVESIIRDPGLGLLVKGAILAAIAGFVILFISTAREKLFVRKRDKYREVKR